MTGFSWNVRCREYCRIGRLRCHRCRPGIDLEARAAVVGRPSEAAITAKRDNCLQSHLVRKLGYSMTACPVAAQNAFPARDGAASLDIRAERAEFQFSITENRIATRVFLQPGIFT